MDAAESVPAALGLVVAARGDPMLAIELAVNSGGDTDTVAAMAGAVAGALRGADALDRSMVEEVERANSLDLEELAEGLARTAITRLGGGPAR